MKQRVKLTFGEKHAHLNFDGTLRTMMAPPDQVTFERTYKVAIGAFKAEAHAEWILWFIWRAWKRENRTELDFEEFIQNLEDYETDEKDDAEGDAGPPEEAPPA